MNQPVIFLAFSNSATGHLAVLQRERKMITDQLIPLESKQYFQLHVEPNAELSDIVQYFTQFKDRIAFFHYGGHADEKTLFLEDGSADAGGLANIFATQKNLQCIFLNGCSTSQQVNFLLRKGVPAVVATHASVADPIAYEFAQVFYRALAQSYTLKEAFDFAAGNYQAQKGTAPKISKVDKLPESTEELPWGLYIKKSKKEVLNWKLPHKSAASFTVTGGQYQYDNTISPNIKLIETIANAISPYSFAVKLLIESAKSSGKTPKLRDLRAAVINAFPTPIGFHLRKLILTDTVDLKRLKKLINIYTISTQLLAYILVAQLWDEKYSQPKLAISPESKQILRDFFEQDHSSFKNYDFVQLLRVIGRIFEKNNIPFFVEEFAALRSEFKEETAFYKACQTITEIRQLLHAQSIEPDNIESLCVQAEQNLCIIFEKIGFAAKYTLMTIKNIELIKIRHQQPKYQHNLVILDKLTASFGELDDTLESEDFGESESVLLLLDEEKIVPNLNLSPFLIDENALTRQKNSKIFLWDCKNEENHRYLLSDNLLDTIDINESNFGQVQELLNRFFIDVLRSD